MSIVVSHSASLAIDGMQLEIMNKPVIAREQPQFLLDREWLDWKSRTKKSEIEGSTCLEIFL